LAATSHLLIDAGGATLAGGGSLVLSNSATNKISGVTTRATLTNVDNLIEGGGTLGGGHMLLVNGGRIVGNAAAALIIITSSTVQNAGTITAQTGGGVEIKSAINNTGVLIAQRGTMTLDRAVTGTGSARIFNGTLIADADFSENVGFTGANGLLELADSEGYVGRVYGFSHSGTTSLDLRDIGFVSASEATFNGTNTGGTLTVTDGTHTAKIKLVGDYTGATFVAGSDGHGGTTVVDPLNNAAVHSFVAAVAGTPRGGSPLSPQSEWPPPFAGVPLTSPRSATR
jgi:hypothetical protein